VGEKSEFDELRKKIEAAGMPKEVLDKAISELKKLEAMPPMSAESTVSRNYIDWLLAVPWKKRSKEPAPSTTRKRCSTPTTTASKKSKSAFLNSSPCANSSKIRKAPSSASPGPSPGV